jgi:hypothetical protein
MTMKKTRVAMISAAGLAFSLLAAPVVGDEWEDEREDEASPFGFLFGNHIDTHQATKLGSDGELSGAFFIIFTGEVDPASGLPVARHPRGAMHNEECGFDVDCVTGWRLRAKPGEAKFLFHSGVNGNDHPVWGVNRVDIPQPGSFTHFHWIGADSTDPRAEAGDVPPACDVDMAGELEGSVGEGTLVLDDGTTIVQWEDASVHLGDGAEDFVCPGWFLEIKAVKTFAFQHGGELIPVRPKIDNATHLNLLTNYALVPGITPTR